MTACGQLSAFCRGPQPACARTWPGTSFSVRTNCAIGACIVPMSLARSSSRLGMSASALTSFADITQLGIAPRLDDELVVRLGKLVQHLGGGHRVGRNAVRERADHLVGQLLERRSLDRAAREGVLQHAKVDARFARLAARSSVMLPTPRPRYSATTIAWAFAISAETSATTAFFSSRLRLKVYLLRLRTLERHRLQSTRTAALIRKSDLSENPGTPICGMNALETGECRLRQRKPFCNGPQLSWPFPSIKPLREFQRSLITRRPEQPRRPPKASNRWTKNCHSQPACRTVLRA